MPFSVGAFVASGAAVPFIDRLGRRLVTVGLVLFVAAVAWFGQTVNHHGNDLGIADMIGPMALGGVGLALSAIPLIDVALANTDVSDAGAASAVLGTSSRSVLRSCSPSWAWCSSRPSA